MTKHFVFTRLCTALWLFFTAMVATFHHSLQSALQSFSTLAKIDLAAAK
jgi:hypothetical protein